MILPRCPGSATQKSRPGQIRERPPQSERTRYARPPWLQIATLPGDNTRLPTKNARKFATSAPAYFTVKPTELETAPLGLVTTTGVDAEALGTTTVTFNCVALTNVTWLPVNDVLPTVTFRPVPDWKFVPLTVNV